MKRRAHILTRNKMSEYPREVIVVDTETEEVQLGDGLIGHRLVFGWARYSRRHRDGKWSAAQWVRFTEPKDFWSWTLRRCRKKARVIIYCHNAEFDAQVVNAFGELHRRRWRLVTACLEGPPTIIKWRRGERTVQWLDTLNIWRVPLADIGEKIGLPKLDMPESWGDVERADTYCRRDCDIVWNALLQWWQFLQDNDLGNAAPTLAAQAMTTYRHRFMRHEIFIDDNTPALELARRAYVGGRCECFRLGMIEEPGVTLDINSMYPFIMRDMEVPIRLLAYRTMAELPELLRYMEQYCCVAEVEVDTDEPAYPCVIEGRLCFPVGRFRVALATPELAHAIAHGRITRLYRVAVYERAQAFREYMDWGWEMRQHAKATGDARLLWQSKYLINSFYGKWGQRGRTWEVIGEDTDDVVRSRPSFDIDTGEWRRLRQIGHSVQELVDKGESMNSSPAIAAHVTSAARMHLWALMQHAGRSNVWYTDTDSLKGPQRLAEKLLRHIDAERLGALKLEERFPWIELRGCKDYSTPGSNVHKGVRANAQSNDGVAYLQTQWYGWAGSIASGRLDMPTMRDTVKVLSRDYTKGTVTASGLVVPLRLGG